jgi:type IV secretion system protein VirB9
MRLLTFLLAVGALLAPLPSMAQVRPLAGAGDPRLKSLSFDADAVYQLNVKPGIQMALIFGAGEQILSVALGDTDNWLVEATASGDTLFISAGTGAPVTNMTVITDNRIYSFQLMSGGYDETYVVRFVYPAVDGLEDGAVPMERPLSNSMATYRFKGEKALRPTEIWDDGTHTYIRFAPDASLPAIFGVSETGEEVVVNGHMRQGVFVIDDVYPKLIFRSNKKKASAERQP